jgi:hypothetical protein
MSHILKKMAIRGAGGKDAPEPEPPVYHPPRLGELQYGASFSYSETIDLVSDGPIEGLVNRHGRRVSDEFIMQGIYLDDTPVAVTPSEAQFSDTLSEAEAAAVDIAPMALNSVAGTGIKSCRRFFQELNNVRRRSSAGRLTGLRKGSNRTIDKHESIAGGGGVTMVYMRRRTSSWHPDGNPPERNCYSLYVRAFVKYRSGGGQRFYWHLNGNSRYEYNSDSMAVYRNGCKRKGGSNGIKGTYWTDSSANLFGAKFFFGISAQKSGVLGVLGRTNLRAQQCVDGWRDPNRARGADSELKAILKLYTDNNNEADETYNVHQRTLAMKALGNLGSSWLNGSVSGLLSNWLNHGPVHKRFVAIVKVGHTGPHASMVGKNILEDGKVRHMVTYPFGANAGFNLIKKMASAGIRWRDITCPIIDTDGNLTGEMRGFLVFTWDTKHSRQTMKKRLRVNGRRQRKKFGDSHTYWFTKAVKDAMKDITSFQYSEPIVEEIRANEFDITNLKYNFSNVLAEVTKGEELQGPLDNFTKIYIDHVYNAELFGPFSSKGQIFPQRIKEGANMLQDNALKVDSGDSFNLNMRNGLPTNEGSDDERDSGGSVKDYSSWARDSVVHWDERALPCTHTVYNPNVTSCFITLNISRLRDTMVNDVDQVNTLNGKKDMSIGTIFPSVLNFVVEVGKIGRDGVERPTEKWTYRVVALIEGSTLIDIGNPDSGVNVTAKSYVTDLAGGKLNLPFKLPNVKTYQNQTLSADGTRGIYGGETGDDGSTEKRYIRVTKLSYETNSILLSKNIALQKVTEIIPLRLPYPFSALVGVKLDSRAFGSIPKRSYDCKLKKVRIPSNYNPVADNGKDKRYYDSVQKFDNTEKEYKQVYDGDWDGTFHDDLMWTDNPAWILYDLLVSNRYGMGTHIDVSSINKWQLYNIGRFCDAVDEDGYFEGVTDGRGGKEPRFSCNIVFDKGQKIFDAINTIAGIFRGRTFFANSEVNFTDDRPRETVNLFTNESVKEGLFHYSNNRRDEQFNTIEVAFRDRFDNFSPKLEVVEDEGDIRERGVFKKRIEGVGITSRAMARRVGQHQIFSKIKENQKVAFTAGLESLLCQPGDLIVIEDELKTNKANFGRILAVDLEAETVRLSNTFVDADMTGRLTVYTPTGRDTIQDIDDIADINRHRYASFTVTGAEGDAWQNYTGYYGFSGYTPGYTGAEDPEASGEVRSQQYGLYTGFTTGTDSTPIPARNTSLYFETGVTGWIFGSGDCRANFSGDLIAVDNSGEGIESFGTGNVANLDMTEPDKRGASVVAFSGFDYESFLGPWEGVLESETTLGTPDQMTVLNVTGNILSTPSELQTAGFNNYGSVVSGFDSPDLLPFLKLGSPAKFEIKDASPFIYKVVGMKEEAPNEYLVTATKYETGKFDYIENNISIEKKADTYSYQVAQMVHDITYATLVAPVFTNLTTGVPDLATETFAISGDFTSGAADYPTTATTGYYGILQMPNGEWEEETISSEGDLAMSFSGLRQVGVYNMRLNALGNKGADGFGNAYFDSQSTNSGIFVVYDALTVHAKSFLDQITIL